MCLLPSTEHFQVNLTFVLQGQDGLPDVDAVRDEALVLHLHLQHEQVVAGQPGHNIIKSCS